MKNPYIIPAAMICAAILAGFWMLKSPSEQPQKVVVVQPPDSRGEIAERALFAVQNEGLTNLVEIAEAYARVSTDQAGEPVAERALILSAKTWLEAANYDKAQAAFENYLDHYANGHWSNEAKLGQAICKEAKGETETAISDYKSLINSTDKAVQSRATALLEAAQTKLDPQR
jgi:outer membrane protein assembly factor BamD (BamD/ComL family)